MECGSSESYHDFSSGLMKLITFYLQHGLLAANVYVLSYMCMIILDHLFSADIVLVILYLISLGCVYAATPSLVIHGFCECFQNIKVQQNAFILTRERVHWPWNLIFPMNLVWKNLKLYSQLNFKYLSASLGSRILPGHLAPPPIGLDNCISLCYV